MPRKNTNKYELLKRLVMIVLIIAGIAYIASYLIHDAPFPVNPGDETSVEQQRNDLTEISVGLRQVTVEKTKPDAAPAKPENKADSQESSPKHHHYNKSDASIKIGENMIGDKGQKIGSFPDIDVNYQQHLGFSEYFQSMRRIGGRFFIMNETTGKIVARIALGQNQLLPRGDLSGLSPRSRKMNEPLLQKYITAAETEYGPGFYSAILLLPINVDHHIIGAISQAMEHENADIQDFSKFDGIYVKKNSTLYLGIFKGYQKNGDIKSLNVSIALSG